MPKSINATQERKASPKAAEPKASPKMKVFAVLVPESDAGDVELPASATILGVRTLSLEPSLSKSGKSLTLGNIGPRDAEGGEAPMVEATVGGHRITARLGYGVNLYLTSGAVKEASPEAFKAAQFEG